MKLLNAYKLSLVLLSACLCFSLLSCSSKGKQKDMPYMHSKSAAKLKIPDDLNTPEQSVLFEIPPVPDSNKPLDVDSETLERPPALVKEAEIQEEDE